MSERVDGPHGPLGVLVVKAEFDQMEKDWSSDHPTFAADRQGVILVTSIPSWRFMALETLPKIEKRRLSAELRFGPAPLNRMDTEPQLSADRTPMITSVALPGRSQARFMAASADLGVAD